MKHDDGRPGWYRLTWFLGRPPQLTPRQWQVLGLVAIVSLFEQYDLYLFSLSLKQIQADLAVSEADLGWLGSTVRLGALFALPIALAADRYGRRKLLLLTVIAYTVLTGATAFAPNAETFVVLQFLARAFAVAETLIAVVVIAEEFAPEHRGWGIGALGAIQACGAGLASLAFGFVEVLPWGWRSLYLIGLIPLTLVAYWRRVLPETDRFAKLQREREASARVTPALEPFQQLAKNRRAHVVALVSICLVFGLAHGPASFFAPKYLQDVHGWSPASVAGLMVFGGMFAIIGNPLAGWLSDRHGRRPMASLFSFAFALVTIAFYSIAGVFAPGLWILLIFAMMGTEVTIAAFGAELFDTSQRSTASGMRAVSNAIGTVLGLAAISILFPILGSNWTAITILAGVCCVVPLIAWFAFPETARRTLEQIAGRPEQEAEVSPSAPIAAPTVHAK